MYSYHDVARLNFKFILIICEKDFRKKKMKKKKKTNNEMK